MDRESNSGGRIFGLVHFAVGNIPYQATEQDVANYFSQCGNVAKVR